MNTIGILDPNGKKKNPLTGKSYENIYSSDNKFEYPSDSKTFYTPTYKNLSKIWSNLIVYGKRKKMIKAISKNKVILIKAGTGVGKTVLVPKFALHSVKYKDNVLCCIPKKIITKETAEFAAKCLDVKLGEEVGYYYKGERQVNQNGKTSKLTFTTIGSLFSRITGDDPDLSEYKVIIIDEAHERSIQTDFVLLLIKKVLQRRKDLKLIIMSATIDLDKFRNFYKKFKFGEIDAGEETTYKIKDHFLKEEPDNWKKYVIKVIIHILKKTKNGDILVFVRSGADGRQLCDKLGKELNKTKLQNDFNPFCIELESKSSLILHPISKVAKSKYATSELLYKTHPDMKKENPYTRKIVMSTNVAESSLTVKGVVFVIDSGLEFSSKYNPDTMSRSLLDEWIPRSSVMQRRGRAGRTQDGVCFHLYSKEKYKKMEKYPMPDIQKTDLSEEFLDILRMENIQNTNNLRQFLNQLIDPPNSIFIKSGLRSLEYIDAIKGGKITQLGLMITKFRGVKPIYAKSIILSHFYDCKRELIDIITLIILLDARIDQLFMDNRIRMSRSKKKKGKRKGKSTSKINNEFISKNGDYFTLLKVYQKYYKYRYDEDHNQHETYQWCYKNNINYKILSEVKNKAIDITTKLNNLIKDTPDFSIEISDKHKTSEDVNKRIRYCLTHPTNIAKQVNNNVYTTMFPIKKIEAKVNKKTTLREYSKNIIFDELFLSKEGYKFNIVSNK